MEQISYKNVLTLIVLHILREHSDEQHPLSQKEIVEICCRDYLKVDRKAIQRRLKYLVAYGEEFGFPVRCGKASKRTMTRVDRQTGHSTDIDTSFGTDYYLDRDSRFDEAEVRLLIDSVLFSNYIPHHQRVELAEKLGELAGPFFGKKVRHIATYEDQHTDNAQFFYTVDMLNEAIEKGRQVTFSYLEYGTDKQLHKRCRPDGTVREYLINPYQMVIKEGKYYLICNYDKFNDVSNYRIDRIADIAVLETPVKPFEKLNGAAKGSLNLSKYMKEHLYMFTGDTVHAEFSIPLSMVSDVIERFGTDVVFSDRTDTRVTVAASVNETSMCLFAKMYMPQVKILWPEALVERMKADLAKAMGDYAQS